MPSALRMLFLALTVALLGTGAGGLRALHLATEAGNHGDLALHVADESGAGTDAHHDDHHDHDRDHHHVTAMPGDSEHADRHHDEGECATCELLLSLVGTTGTPVLVPAFHALVAVTDDASPAPAPPAAPLRALTARPPPSC
jgi:hypothetical protein